MRLAVYGAVLVIALGSVLLGLDRLPAPMSPMVDTAAGLAAAPAPPLPAPIAQPTPTVPNATPSATPSATMGAPIVPPALAAPARPAAPAPAGAATQAAAPVAASEPEVRCNVDACTAAYRSFTRSDCTYQPSNGPRRLCTK
jgi:BA14K-like protein